MRELQDSYFRTLPQTFSKMASSLICLLSAFQKFLSASSWRESESCVCRTYEQTEQWPISSKAATRRQYTRRPNWRMGWTRWESLLHAHVNHSLRSHHFFSTTLLTRYQRPNCGILPSMAAFLPVSLSVIGVMAFIKIRVRATYEWDWHLARILKKHACIVDVQKKMLAFAMALHTLCI